LQQKLNQVKTYQKIENIKEGTRNDLEEKIRARIESKIVDIKGLDPQRLHSEVLFYLDRMDIAEELERLESHFAQIDSMLIATDDVGRKLDFLVQEFNREFNTIASKVQNAELTHFVVDAKMELEKIREQIQNIV